MQTRQGRKQIHLRKWLSTLIAVSLLFSIFPGSLLAAGMKKAATQAQPATILLGEYVQRPAAKGDVFTFAIYLPEDGDYMISPDDDKAAQNFKATVFDELDNAVYRGPLTMEATTLSAGQYIIEVTALDDAFLSFFVLGMIGSMSSDERAVGKLSAGSVYSEENVSSARYATIHIPDVGYPQEVLVFFQAGQGDVFSLSVEGGESVSEAASSDDTDMLRFYSEGGAYALTREPQERRSQFTVIVFLAGQPDQLALDGTLDATLAANADTQISRMSLDDVYDDVTITLTPPQNAETQLQMSIVDHYEGGAFYAYADAQEDGSLVISTGSLLPGDYYIVVNGYDGVDVDYQLSATGAPGAPMLALTSGQAVDGSLEDGDAQYYRIDGVDAGTFLRVTLTSDATDSDFDLNVGVAQPLDQWSSTTAGPNEEVLLVAPGDGTYFVQVLSYSGAGDYQLLVEDIPDVGLIDANRLYRQTIDDDGSIVYGFEITEPGQLLSVLIASQQATDLDLSVVHFSPKGVRVHDLSSTSTGSSEIVSQAAADPGIYEVRVEALGAGGDFGLLVRVESPASLIGAPSTDKATVLLSDDFSDPQSGWSVDSENGAYGYRDGAYQITAEPGIYRRSVQNSENYTDVSLEIDIVQESGGPEAYSGLICRSSKDGFYYADISPAGNFNIGKYVGEDLVVLTDWTDSAAINTTTGAVNTLRMDCIGDTITAYVNDVWLDSVTVETASGGFGLEACNGQSAPHPATFVFDNLVLRQP